MDFKTINIFKKTSNKKTKNKIKKINNKKINVTKGRPYIKNKKK
jgi:hypothetical protein